MSTKKRIRQQQTQLLMRENAIGMTELAACLGLDEDKLEAMVGESPNRQLTDALARLMEQTFSKPIGWLDNSEDGGINYDLFG